MRDVTKVRPNPYFLRGPIKRGKERQKYFFGREMDLGFLMQSLARGECVSVSGPRRIGKTSLFFRVFHPSIRVKYSLDEHYLLVYFDCQGMEQAVRSTVYRLLCDEVIYELHCSGTDHSTYVSSLPTDNETIEDSLRKLVKWTTNQGFQVIFLFDEFETLANNHHLGKGFFSYLRSLSHNYQVAYATSSYDTLYAVTYRDQTESSSSFFGNFQPMRLGLMELEEAKELINGPALQEGHAAFTDQEAEYLINIAGTFPFFLQMACYHLFQVKNDSVTLDYDQVRKSFTQEAEDHFDYAWRCLSDKEKALVKDIAEGSLVELSEMEKQTLTFNCLIDDQDNLFSSAFADFVKHQARPSLDMRADKVNEMLEASLLKRKHLAKLLRILSSRFSKEELRHLCFILGIDYDDLPAPGKENKARELVAYLERRGRILELIKVGEQLRTDIPWASIAKAVETTSSEQLLLDDTIGQASYPSLAYELGLERMKRLLNPMETDVFVGFAVLEQQLLENLDSERQFGPSEGARSERTQVIKDLNLLAYRHLSVSFNDLCRADRSKRHLDQEV